MAIFWIQEGEWARGGNNSVRFGDLVKPFGRKYKGMWRVFGINENGEIMLISDECIGEVKMFGLMGYHNGIDQVDQLCIDTVKSKKVAAVRSVNGLDIHKASSQKESYTLLKPHLFERDCWLAASYACNSAIYNEVGMEAIFGGVRINLPLSIYGGTEYSRTLGVRAIVTLRKNVEFHKTKDGYWKI